MASNYFAPTFQVEINSVGLAADISKYIEQIEITSERNSLDQVSLTVVNPYPDMRWTHNEDDAQLFYVGNAITVSLGYVGEELLNFSGEITQVSANFSSGGTPTLNVEGRTRLHRLTRRRRTQTFNDRTDKQIVEQIAGDHNLTPEVEETSISYSSVTQRNQTDLEFLLERARRINFEFRVEDRTLIFQPAQESQSPVAVLEWGKSLQSFTPTLNSQGQVNQVTVRGYDPREKKEIVGQFSGNGAGGRSGPEVAEEAFGSGEDIRVDRPVSSQEEADRLAEAYYHDQASRFLTGRGTTIGLPALQAGQFVEIAGLGQFNGIYRLTRVTHSLSSSGYTTNFSGEWRP